MATEYTSSFNTLLKDTLVDLPGVIRSVALRELRLAMREFFEKSLAWTTIVDPITTPTGDTAVQVDDGDANTEVIAVLGVAFGNNTDGWQALWPMADEPISYYTAESPSHWFVTSNPDEFKVFPYVSPATTKSLKAKVALIPADGTDPTQNVLPRQIELKYYEAIRSGFLARMFGQPYKPYSDPAKAKENETKFRMAIGFYAGQRKTGYNGAQNWRYPLGWGVRRRK